MSSRLVLDEFDVNLPPLASGLVFIIIIVVGSGTDARTLDAASVSAVAGRIVVGVWGSIGIRNVGHYQEETREVESWFVWIE